MELSCVIHKKNLGKSKCNKMPTVPKMIIETPDNFFLEPADYATDAALKAALQDLLVAPVNSRGFLWPQFSSFENVSQEAGYEDTIFGMIPMIDGQYRFKMGIHKNMCTHKAIQSHRMLNEGRAFIIDMDNQIWGYEDEATGNIYGFSLALLWTEKFMFGDGTSNATKSPVFICLADNEEFDKSGVLIETKIINQLERLTDVTLTTVGAIAAAAFTVEVKQSCDGVPLSGLVLADFILYAADGVATQVIQTVAEDANIPGRYLLSAPGGNDFEDGTLTLRAPSALTVKAYEAEAAIAINIP